MKIISKLYDGRVRCDNFLIELTIAEYLHLASAALEHNEFQRKRVRGSKTVYSLLKEDILKGCVIPPLVLAIAESYVEPIEQFLPANRNRLLILDGLQRTHSLIDVQNELQALGDSESLERFYAHILRCELYAGLNRLGVLYRMLTLNTGQTPMSLRQQIEMLYIDYSHVEGTNIQLVREAEDRPLEQPSDYRFREVIDGFNSFLERDELPLDRSDLLENIKGLGNLSKEEGNEDVFKEFVVTMDSFITATCTLLGDHQLSDEYVEANGIPWGLSGLEVFKRSQSFTGFGAALGRLKDSDLVDKFSNARDTLANLQLTIAPTVFLEKFNDKMLDIKRRSKKIGNSQRLFFAYYFRELLNPESESYGLLDMAIAPAYRKFESQTF